MIHTFGVLPGPFVSVIVIAGDHTENLVHLVSLDCRAAMVFIIGNALRKRVYLYSWPAYCLPPFILPYLPTEV